MGWDYIPFGMICDIGFSMDPGQEAKFSNIEIRNYREPNNILFEEEPVEDYDGIFADHLAAADGSYLVDGGDNGMIVTADPSRNSTPMLRKEFDVDKRVESARLYVTARGIYEVQINGNKIGSDFYNPGQTQYNKSHFYQTYDVTELIESGNNAIGAMLAEGWWSGLLSFGEVWNEGWSSPGFDDSNWGNARVVPLEGTSYTDNAIADALSFDDMKLIGQIGNNAGEYETLTSKSVEEVRPGVFVYDMGQNFVGVPRITFENGIEGDTIILRVSEMLYPDLPESGQIAGMIMTENYRAALCQDIYIMKDGPQVFQPKFTSRGYQYIEITGIEMPLPPSAVKGVAISSVLELTAGYTTSNDQVNQLWSNLCWSNVDNFLTLPTDCPQRNERMGWSGDISVFSRTATYISNSDQFL
ncbi:MAG: family 78 glycoside hydrolase catalytic domain, partial [Cyclobacteriaceae bacterium]